MDAENPEYGVSSAHGVNPVEGYSHQSIKENDMSESTTKNFFENPNATGNAGWSAAGGALVGSLIGENGILGGNKGNAVTPDQLGTAINGLQTQMSTDALQAHLGRVQGQIASSSADSTIALGAGLVSVKDAVVNSGAQTQLALCGLGHNLTAGIASVNNSILMQGAASRELALQQALDAERAAKTELRIELSEHKNQAGHNATQVLLNQVINAKGV